MKLSARNQIPARMISINTGEAIANVELDANGTRLVASITVEAVKQLVSYLATCLHDGLAPGVKGWWDDATAHRQPWGFELAAISVPVLLMHGRQDRFVPFGHGQWLAGHIPGVEARLLDHDGHLSLLASRIPEVHGWLKERM